MIETTQPKTTHYFVVALTAGSSVFILLLVGLLVLVRLEEQERSNKSTMYATPKPIEQQTTLPSIAPKITYQPQIPDMSKEEVFALFQAVTFHKDIYRTDKHLVRWESQNIPWQLRGQFTAEDTQCMQSIEKQFNSAMSTSKLEEQSKLPQSNGISIYILPSDQFSSVNPDIRPENPAQMFFTLTGYNLSSATLLIDTKQSIEFRCYYLRNLMLRAVGLESPILANYLVGESTSPSFLQYGRLENLSHSEMLRLLYSPLLTAGLTEEEVKRRIFQE